MWSDSISPLEDLSIRSKPWAAEPDKLCEKCADGSEALAAEDSWKHIADDTSKNEETAPFFEVAVLLLQLSMEMFSFR